MKDEVFKEKVKKGKNKNKAKKKSFVFRLALIAFSIYTVYSFVQLQVQAEKKQAYINSLNDEMQQLQSENEVLQEQCDNYEVYLEMKAREQGLARPDEKIYIGSPGN